MPRQPSRTQSTNSSGAKKSGTGSSPSSALVDVDSLPRTTRSWSDSQVPTDYVFSSSLTSLNPAPISSPPGSPKCIPGSSLASVKSNVVTPPATISRALPIHPQPTVDASIGSPTKRAALERTQVVWMFVGDTPSITRTSPTPPPPLLPETRALRRSPVLMHMPNALRPLGHPPVAGPSPLRQSSQARTLEDYDQTNARIRTLHAELLADPRSQPAPRSGLRSSASRTLRSDGGGGVRYLNVPGAATDALMAVRHRAARRCTSATGTGIVDISDSESSQFESDDDGNDGEESEPTPPVPRAGTKTVAEARSDPRISRNNPCERPEQGQAASTATTPVGSEVRVSAAGPCNSIAHPPPRTDAPGLHRQPVRADPFVHDRVAEHHRLQPAHSPALFLNDTPASTLPLLDPKGKKRARDLDVDGGPWPDSDRADRLALEGKRKKTTPVVSLPVTPPPSRPSRTDNNSSRNRLDTSASRFRQ